MLILRLLLALLLVEINHSLDLILAVLLWQDKLINQPVFTHHDALLINNVIEFAVVFLKNIVFIILIFLVVL